MAPQFHPFRTPDALSPSPTGVTLLSSAPLTMSAYVTWETVLAADTSDTSTPSLPSPGTAVGTPGPAGPPGGPPPPPPPPPGPPPTPDPTSTAVDESGGAELRVPIWVCIVATGALILVLCLAAGLTLWLCRRRRRSARSGGKDLEGGGGGGASLSHLAYDSLTSLTPHHSLPLSPPSPPPKKKLRPTRPRRPPPSQRPSTAERIAHGFTSLVRPTLLPPLTISAPVPIPTISLIPPSPSETMFTSGSASMRSFESSASAGAGEVVQVARGEALLPVARAEVGRAGSVVVGAGGATPGNGRGDQVEMVQLRGMAQVQSTVVGGGDTGRQGSTSNNVEKSRQIDEPAAPRNETWFGYQDYKDSATHGQLDSYPPSRRDEIKARESTVSEAGLAYRFSQSPSPTPATASHLKPRNSFNSGTDGSLYSVSNVSMSMHQNESRREVRLRESERVPVSREVSVYDAGDVVWDGARVAGAGAGEAQEEKTRVTDSVNLALWEMATGQQTERSSVGEVADSGKTNTMRSTVLFDPRRLSTRVVSSQAAPLMPTSVFRLTDSPSSSFHLSVGEREWESMLRHESSWSFLNEFEREQLRSPTQKQDLLSPNAPVPPLSIAKKPPPSLSDPDDERYPSWASAVPDRDRRDEKADRSLSSIRGAELFQLPPLEYDTLSDDFERSFSSGDISVPQVHTITLDGEKPSAKETSAALLPPSRIPVRIVPAEPEGLGLTTSAMLSPPRPGARKRRSLSSPVLSTKNMFSPKASDNQHSNGSVAPAKGNPSKSRSRTPPAENKKPARTPKSSLKGSSSASHPTQLAEPINLTSTSGLGITSPPPGPAHTSGWLSSPTLRSSSTSRIKQRADSPARALSPSQNSRRQPLVSTEPAPWRI